MKLVNYILSLFLVVTLVGCTSSSKDSKEVTKDVEVSREYTSETKGVFNVSINPEIEFEIDQNKNITAVIYCNDDAKEAYEKLELEGMSANDAMALVVKTANEKGYLKDGKDVTLKYGATGYATTEESNELIDSARSAVVDALNQSGKDTAVVLEVDNYSKDDSICDLCYGVGKVICDLCGGKSYGNGKVKCDNCNGEGQVTPDNNTTGNCRDCNGTGIKVIQAQKCYVCNGTGKCINCKGTGQEQNDDGSMGSCHACGGDGDCLQEVCVGGTMKRREETCDTCGGSGNASAEKASNKVASCNRCNGEKYMTCNRCKGKLMTTCNRCNGTGKQE